MMSWTRAASRADSLCMRLANRRTASGSSADDSSASASSEMAPTGVFSSWETLATKSLRISSVRVNLGAVVGQQEDIFLARCTAARTWTTMVPWPSGPRGSSSCFSRMTPSRRTLAVMFQQLLVHHGVAAHQAVGVGGGAGPDHAVDRVHHHEGPADDGEHLRGALRQRGVVDVDVDELPLLLTDPEREHAKDAKRQADQAGDHADEHWIHGSSLCSATRPKPKSPAIRGAGSANVHLLGRNSSPDTGRVDSWSAGTVKRNRPATAMAGNISEERTHTCVRFFRRSSPR